MNHNIAHTAKQLDTRGLPYSLDRLVSIASQFVEDTAVILGKVKSFENPRYTDKVILIVRGGVPMTIMTRRESQNFDKRNFSVSKIVYI
jgi:hypothetical protein